ncbi:putative ABC transporter permease [Roseburia hominis]
MNRNISKETQFNISYAKMFWLFIFGSILGVVLEGIFCWIRYGRWETHVVSVWGPFCILYGFGAVGFYLCHARLHYKKWWIQFLIYCTIGFGIELICGCLLEFGLHMRAWDYSSHFMNIRGHVSLKMTIVWGIVGIAFSQITPYIDKALNKLNSDGLKILSYIITIFMLVNLVVTAAAVWRWKDRHYNVLPQNRLEEFLDQNYDDNFMAERFCEWRFLD